MPLKHLPRAVVGEPIRMFAMDAAYERQIRALVPTGDSAGELVSVIGPIDAGDRVAIRGAENLQEGSDVRVLSNPESTLSSASSDS